MTEIMANISDTDDTDDTDAANIYQVKLKDEVKQCIVDTYEILKTKLKIYSQAGSTVARLFIPYNENSQATNRWYDERLTEQNLIFGFRTSYFRTRLKEKFLSDGIDLRIYPTYSEKNKNGFPIISGYVCYFRWDQNYQKECLIL